MTSETSMTLHEQLEHNQIHTVLGATAEQSTAPRVHPEGKERREFPKTRVRTPTNLRILDRDDEEGEAPADQVLKKENKAGKSGHQSSKLSSSTGEESIMGGGDERYYGTSSRSNRCSSREYAAQQTQHFGDHYGRSRAYHAHPPRRSRGDLYGEAPKASSPYHHSGTLRRSERSGDYLILRQQQQQQQAAAAAAEYDRIQHHSGSRSDLLEHDHNSIYDHFTPPSNQYSFVRTCDGNFVKTLFPPTIPKYGSEDASASAAASSSSSSYRANHTLRRPSKRSHHSSSTTSGQTGDFCCRDEYGSMSSSSGPPQSYATLRGRKWTEKARGSCGDNYGRLNYLDPDSRMVLVAAAVWPNNSILLRTLAASGGRVLSRSTDRNLDNLGLSEDELLLSSTTSPSNHSSGLAGIRCSDEVLSLLIREPPDGKEKPEPASSKNNNKLAELSHAPAHHIHHSSSHDRKASKGELLELGGCSGEAPPPPLILSGQKSDTLIKRDSLKETLYDVGNSSEDTFDPKD
ncbi:Uncharacterized protein FKW44_005656, partial [Caligus rogercresseyi]